MKLKLNIDNINTNYKIDKNTITNIVRLIFGEEKCSQGEIGIIFVDHDYIIKLNKEFLNRDNTTDVLSFPLGDSDSKAVIGEIYVNLDRVEEQAAEYHVSFNEEMNRMIIHGLLHLFGYDDQTAAQKDEMTKKENYYLKRND